jgi:hypothetical protein
MKLDKKLKNRGKETVCHGLASQEGWARWGLVWWGYAGQQGASRLRSRGWLHYDPCSSVVGEGVGVKTGGYGRILAHPVSYPNVFKTDSGSDTDS